MKKFFTLIILVFFIFSLTSCNYINNLNNDTNDNTIKTVTKDESGLYILDDDYFSHIDFYNFEENNVEKIYTITECTYDLVSVGVRVVLYDNTKKEIFNYEVNSDDRVTEGSSISLEKQVTKDELNFSNVSTASITYFGRTDSVPNPLNKYYTIKLMENESTEIRSFDVKYEDKLIVPNSTLNSYYEENWYLDKDLNKEFDYNSKVTSDYTLYVSKKVDYKTLTNTVTKEIMSSNILVSTKNYNATRLGIETSYYTYTGSGIIIKKTSSGYYALTNNHVIEQNSDYQYISYSVSDFKGNEYVARVIDSNSSYDLALVYFESTNELNVISIADKNVSLNDDVITISSPLGQINALTYGTVLGYKPVDVTDTDESVSDVTFPVLVHDAYTSHGSSGCAILDLSLKLVGIHFAGSEDADGNFVYGYAIPIEKVNEFLLSVL